MASISPQTTFPIPLFLHCRLAIPTALQAVLQSPSPPKLRKALLTSHTISSGPNKSAVSYDGRNFGEYAGEEVVEGMVYMIANDEEEKRIKDYVGNSCVTKDEEFELMPQGFLGTKQKVRGRVFVRSPNNKETVQSACSDLASSNEDTFRSTEHHQHIRPQFSLTPAITPSSSSSSLKGYFSRGTNTPPSEVDSVEYQSSRGTEREPLLPRIKAKILSRSATSVDLSKLPLIRRATDSNLTSSKTGKRK